MKSESWRLPDGVDELLPPQAWRLELVRRKVLDLFHDRGFEYIEPPLIEYLDALLVAGGRDLDLQTLKAVDQRSGRLLGVRADLTSQAARIDASQLGAQGVARLCYAGPVVHANPQNLMDSRVPIKAGAEIFGSPDLEADAEIIALMLEVVRTAGCGNSGKRRLRCPIEDCTHVFKRGALGWDTHVQWSPDRHTTWHSDIKIHAERKELFQEEFSDWLDDPDPSQHPNWFADSATVRPVLVLGDMGIYRALAASLHLTEDDEQALFSAVQCKSQGDVRALVGDGALSDLLVALPGLMGRMDVLDRACTELADAPAAVGSALTRLRRLVDLVAQRCPDADIRFDLAELAGYGYHNGPVFAAFHGGHGQALARGGRYDGIGATFGRKRPATGFDVNLKRLLNSATPLSPGRLPGKRFGT